MGVDGVISATFGLVALERTRKVDLHLAGMMEGDLVVMVRVGLRQIMTVEVRNGRAHAPMGEKQDAKHQQGQTTPHRRHVASSAYPNNAHHNCVGAEDQARPTQRTDTTPTGWSGDERVLK